MQCQQRPSAMPSPSTPLLQGRQPLVPATAVGRDPEEKAGGGGGRGQGNDKEAVTNAPRGCKGSEKGLLAGVAGVMQPGRRQTDAHLDDPVVLNRSS